MAGFFPLFFKNYWAKDLDPTQSTWLLGLTSSLASLAMALSAPFLGGMADHGIGLKRLLALTTVLGALATGTLFWIPSGEWLSASIFFGLASFGFFSALTFYDALLVHVSPRGQLDRVSSLGYGLGYLGGGLLFAVNVLMFIKPHLFGIEDGPTAVRWSFLSVAVWWLLFSFPLFRYVTEPTRQRRPLRKAAIEGVRELKKTLRSISGQPEVWLFLVTFLMYNDGVNTIIKMAVDYGMALGFASDQLIQALLMVQFIGFPSAILFGFLSEKIGPRRGILICIGVYMVVTLGAYGIQEVSQFYILAATIGLVQGGIQALSRSFFARMVPEDKSAEYFALFNFVGKFSALFGPWLLGLVAVATGNPRAGILVPLIFFVVSFFILIRLKERP